MNIKEIQKEIHDMAKEKGWWDEDRQVLGIHMLIVSEVAEASESWRNHEPYFYFDKKGKPEGEAVELVDALIRILDYAGKMGWDMEKIIMAKMDFNATRPYRHGGKGA